LRTRLTRWGFNCFPAYRATGARITYIAGDWAEVRIRLPLNWRTRNYVGTLFGGSIYGSIDPIYMIMLIKLLGSGYDVWDKSATIRFLRPGRSTLYAAFRVDAATLAEIRNTVAREGRMQHRFTIELTDAAGEIHATCEKVLSVRARASAAARAASTHCDVAEPEQGGDPPAPHPDESGGAPPRALR
jgi:acyl-coenzyme A thioesterase PaaI-like protein